MDDINGADENRSAQSGSVLNNLWQKERAQLLAEQRAVQAALVEAQALSIKDRSDSWQEFIAPNVVTLSDEEFSYRGVLQNRLRSIDEALARVADGSYGYCLECGIKLNPSRLEINPAASRCLVCQAIGSEISALKKQV